MSFDIPIDTTVSSDWQADVFAGGAAARVLALEPHLAARRSMRPLHLTTPPPRDDRRTPPELDGIIGTSAALIGALGQLEKVAPSAATVLVRGETGTGKELIARAVHALSPRRDRPFVKLNCAAIPSGLLESELFGHERGAFTGAVGAHVGRFELAHRGTLFLDEAGDIPLELQAKLLRVLQEQEFERLGGTRTLRVDVRLVAATNRDLEQMVADGEFRADLYYRLDVFPLSLPPLRARLGDLPLLVRHLVARHARRLGKRIDTVPAQAMAALARHNWPGNVRELENVIERAVILASGPELDLPPIAVRPRTAGPQRPPAGTLAEIEREAILSTLHATGGVVGGPDGAAAKLGVKRTTLQSRMEKLGIRLPARSSRVAMLA
jgi:formate hydrogenlyase transcriptional activator